MEFIEAPVFTRLLASYLDDDAYRELQSFLASNPEAGDVIQGTGGFRKVRWADRKRGQGRRGGLRLVYFYFEQDHQIWLLTMYGKGEAADLTTAEKRALKSAIEVEKRERAQRRAPGRK